MDADHDTLKFSQNKDITKNFENQEKIYYSGVINKYNDYHKQQQRNIMITSKGLYNLKGTSIKRNIPISKIKAITVGDRGEFVLHVPDEYDYRYTNPKDIELILTLITQAFVLCTKDKMPFFFKMESSLVNYATTKSDKKKNMCRKPTEGEIKMDSN